MASMFEKAQLFYHNREIEFCQKQQVQKEYILVKEDGSGIDTLMVPRFTLNNSDVFTDVPSNEPLKPTPELILKAIKWGMILDIDYRGDEDDTIGGHHRVIYPLVYGYSKKNKPLIRGFHLKGWSVSKSGPVEKEWRLFRFDRILNITFTGSFFRLAPEGYVTSDKGINTIIAYADFNDIRNLQQRLLNSDKIDTKDKMTLNKVNTVKVYTINFYTFAFSNLFKNNVIKKKDLKNTRLTFCKPLADSEQWAVILGISIEPNRTFKVQTDKGKVLGTYTSVQTMMADEIEKKKITNIEGKVEFKAFIYVSSE